MSFLQLLILSLVQGITEWLPISSSGHIVLISGMFGLSGRDELVVNAMAHLGTLLAVLAYFHRDISHAIQGGLELIGIQRQPNGLSDKARLALLIIASCPAALVLAAVFTQLPDTFQNGLRSLWVVIASTIVFALALWWSDTKPVTRAGPDMNIKDAALIGLTQAIAALLPGTSRSGITMTTARALGFSRTEAARFSMLIGVPIIMASGAYAFYELFGADTDSITLTLTDSLIVIFLSAVSGYAAIAVLMKLLEQIGFLPFVIYRICLGSILLLASPLGLSIIGA